MSTPKDPEHTDDAQRPSESPSLSKQTGEPSGDEPAQPLTGAAPAQTPGAQPTEHDPAAARPRGRARWAVHQVSEPERRRSGAGQARHRRVPRSASTTTATPTAAARRRCAPDPSACSSHPPRVVPVTQPMPTTVRAASCRIAPAWRVEVEAAQRSRSSTISIAATSAERSSSSTSASRPSRGVHSWSSSSPMPSLPSSSSSW